MWARSLCKLLPACAKHMARDVLLQAHISRLQHDLQASQHQQVAVAERSAVLQVENRKLRVEARQNLVMHAPGAFVHLRVPLSAVWPTGICVAWLGSSA